MEINNLKSYQYDELRLLYKKYLQSQNISSATISTAYSDTFYLWRKRSKELLRNLVTSIDFEKEANQYIL